MKSTWKMWKSSFDQWSNHLSSNDYLLRIAHLNENVLIERSGVYLSGRVVKFEPLVHSLGFSSLKVHVKLDDSREENIVAKMNELLPFRRINFDKTSTRISVGNMVLALQDSTKGTYLPVKIDRIEYPSPMPGALASNTLLCCSNGRESTKITLGNGVNLLNFLVGAKFSPMDELQSHSSDSHWIEEEGLSSASAQISNAINSFCQLSTTLHKSKDSSDGSQYHSEYIHALSLLEDIIVRFQFLVTLVGNEMKRSAESDENAVHNFGSPARKSTELREPSSPTDAYSLNITNLLSELCQSLESVPLLVSQMQLPFQVSVQQWVLTFRCAANVRRALAALLAELTALSNDSTSGFNLSLLSQTLQTIENCIQEAGESFSVAVCSFLDQMLLDTVSRQEWKSNSAFMREKRISHGVVALTTTVRSAMFDLICLCGSGDAWYSSLAEEVCFQLLVSVSALLLRVYLQVYPSRVRLFQWKADLSHWLYFVIDSLSWLLKQHPSPESNCENRNACIAELTRIVHYLVVVHHLVGSSCEGDGLIPSLNLLLESPVRGHTKSGEENSLQVLLGLLRCTSLSALVDSLFGGSTKDLLSAPKSTQSSITFDVTQDIVAGCGFPVVSDTSDGALQAFVFLSNEESLLYEKELKSKPDQLVIGQRAVVFQRIISFNIINPAPLLQHMLNHLDSFQALHDVLSLKSPSSNNSWIRHFLDSMMSRRFEFINGEYPVLTPIQTEHKQKLEDLLRRP